MDEATGAKAPSSIPFTKILLFVVKFGIAGGIIAWLLHKDFHRFVECLSAARPGWLAAAAVLIVLQISACAVRWKILLVSQGIKIGMPEVLSLYFQGCFFSLAIPGGAVGGDLVKAGIIATRAPSGKKLEGVLSIAVDRIAGMVALFGLVIVLILPFWGLIDKLDHGMKAAFLLLLVISVLGLLAVAAFPFYEKLLSLKPLKILSEKADALSKGGVGKLIEISRLYKAKWRSVLAAIAVSAFVANPLQIAALYCLVVGVSGLFPDLLATCMAMLFGGSAAAIPLTPGGIGTRDAVCKAGLIAGGVEPGAATAAPLLFTTIFVCISLFGGLLFAGDAFFKRRETGK